MTAITFDNLTEKLIEAVPELRPAYEAELGWWRDERPGQYIVYEDILNPYLASLLDLEGGEEEPLRRIFAFLEMLANHERDPEVPNLVQVAIIEPLLDTARLAKARRYMGGAMLRLTDDLEARWARARASLPPADDPVWRQIETVSRHG